MSDCCQKAVDFMMDYVEGSLSHEDSAELKQHFSDCPSCLDFLESYKTVPEVMRHAAASEMPAEVKDRLSAFLQKKCGC